MVNRYPAPLHNLIINYLKKSSTKITVDGPQNLFDKENKCINEAALNIGIEIINWLETIHLFQEYTTGHNVPHITFVHHYTIDMFVAASYYKPPITTQETSTVFTRKVNDTFNIELNLNTKTISNAGSVFIEPSPELNNIIKYYSEVPMSIESTQLTDFLAFLEIINSTLEYL